MASAPNAHEAIEIPPPRPVLRIKTPKRGGGGDSDSDIEAAQGCQEKCTSSEQLRKTMVPTEDRCLNIKGIRLYILRLALVAFVLGLYLLGHAYHNQNSGLFMVGGLVLVAGFFFLSFLVPT